MIQRKIVYMYNILVYIQFNIHLITKQDFKEKNNQ